MMLKTLLIISSFFLIVMFAGCQIKDNKSIEAPLVDNQTTPAEFIQKYMACGNNSDCWQVKDPSEGCCGRTFAINKTGSKIYYSTFEKEFKKKDEMCKKEYDKGLSCSLQYFEPVCIDEICRLKDKMNGDKIIDNEFSH